MAFLRVMWCSALGYALLASLAGATSLHSSSFPARTSFSHSTLLRRAASLSSMVIRDGSTGAIPTATSSAAPLPTVDNATLTEIEAITERRLTFIVAGAGDPSRINDWLSTLGDDGKWPDTEIDYTTGCAARRANWPAQIHWQRIQTMAAAWHGGLPGAEQFVKNPTLLSGISRAMDFWFSNDFTDPSCLDSGGLASCPCGTSGFWNTNWFSNVIGIPELVAPSCLLITPNLTATQLSNCTNIAGRTYGTLGHVVNGLGVATGANLLDIAKIGIDEGLLNVNVSEITDAYARIHGEVVIENTIKADGIRADGSFAQHGGVLYNGNYGKDFTNDVLVLEIDAGGTQFAAGDTSKTAFATLIDGDQWMIFRNVLTGVLHWDFSVLGRFISFPVADDQATGSIKINVTEIAQLGQEWNSTVLTTVAASLSSKSSNANVGGLNGNRMFFANDYMVQRGTGYVTTVKMYSSRTKNTECLNAQNPLGFHLSDGTVYTYLQGNEYEDIAAAWDWNLIPGITVDYNQTALSCGDASFVGLNAFVGGVSNVQTGIAAMKFTNPLTKSLSWQKAWFFLQSDVQHVMVPIITSNSNAPVYSVLDQKRHNGQVYVNGAELHQPTTSLQAHTLWHDNVGYVFEKDKSLNVTVQVGEKSGDWTAIGISTQGTETVDLFAAWIDHGVSTPVVPISYSMFPAISRKTFNRKAGQLDIQDIRNDQDVSAIYDPRHETAMFVFWNPAGGSVTFTPAPFVSITVASSGNAAVVYRLKTGNVTVSDPSQTLTTLDLTFSLGPDVKTDGGKPPATPWKTGSSKQLHFTLPQGGLAGSSISKKLH